MVASFSGPVTQKFPLGALALGLLIPLVLGPMLVRNQYKSELRALDARKGLPTYDAESFFPGEDPVAGAVLGAARLVWDSHVASLAPVEVEGEGAAPTEPAVAPDAAPTVEWTEELLAERFPALSQLEGHWVISLYIATPGAEISPALADVSRGVKAAVDTFWDGVPPAQRVPELKARSRFKVDAIGEERPFPLDGGYRGVALDEGLDGVVLRHEREADFYALPSWSIERKVRRDGIHGRARRLAREIGGWKRSRTKEADFMAFRSRAWVEAKHGGGPPLPVRRGNTDVPVPNAKLLAERITLAADYMARETNDRGKITYEYQPQQDKLGTGYNMLRHAGTVYSMMQGYRVSPSEELLEASKRGIGYYRSKMREDKGRPGEWYVLDGSRAKLGGVGLGLCMMVEMEKANPGFVDMDVVLGMARHIEHNQKEDGSFDSFYDYGKGLKDPKRKSIYYSGEALLGLVRLYELTGDPHWLDVAEKGADYLVNKRWVALGLRIYIPPDAWLIQALEELDRFRPDDRRAEYAFAIGRSIARNKLMDPATAPPDLLGADLSGISGLPNAATAGAFGEALSAAARLEHRRRPGETTFLTYAMHNARFQLRHQFVEANSWFLPNPARAYGGFRVKVDDSEIRNDYVQHNLSGLFGLLDLLDEDAPDIGWVVPEDRRPGGGS